MKNNYVEVLEILKHIPKDEYEKIPKEKIEFYEKNKNYQYNYSEKQPISRKTNAILIHLYKDYIATQSEKEKIEEILNLNEQKAEIEKAKKYNSQNLFCQNESSKKIEEKSNENSIVVEYNKSFFSKILKKIKKFLNSNS